MANYAVTLPTTQISPLMIPEGGGDFTIRYYIPYTTLTTSGASASADTITVSLGTTPTNWIAYALLVDITTPFAGVSAMTATIGTTTTATAFASSFNTFTQGTYVPPNGQLSVATNSASNGTSALGMTCVFTMGAGATGTATSLSAGFMTILLGIKDPTATP